MRKRYIPILALIVAVLLSGTSSAFIWSNEITIAEDTMTWEYTETHMDQNSIKYRILVDTQIGNSDEHVSAWELMKVDRILRQNLRESLEKKMDVMFDDDSAGIEVVEIDATMDLELLGSLTKAETIENHYLVRYFF